MLAVLTDILQSTSIIIWGVLMLLLVRRVNRLNRRLDQNAIAIAQEREARQYQDPQPVCGCNHHQCFHDEAGCGGVTVHWHSSTPEEISTPCGCKRYTGPEQLPTVIP